MNVFLDPFFIPGNSGTGKSDSRESQVPGNLTGRTMYYVLH